MISANEFGFLPGNKGEENSRALQRALDLGGETSLTTKVKESEPL